MAEGILYFPREFLWGTATSAFQVEGEKVANDWWEWSTDSAIQSNVHHPGNACGWWDGRWKEDFERASSGSQNALRVSIEWARIEPSPGIWDLEALDYYRELLNGAGTHGLSPVVTLHHFSNPSWFSDLGGWENGEAQVYFERYVRKAVSTLKDHARTWITINEPNVYLFTGFIQGTFPPGIRDLERAYGAAKNLILSHASAYHAIHEIQPESLVGIAHHYLEMRPSIRRSPVHRAITRSRRRSFNQLFPQAVHDGRVQLFGRKARIPEASRTQDFFGLNYFTTESVAINPRNRWEGFSEGSIPHNAEVSPAGVIANEPEGMFEALKFAKGFSLPIIITGNGIDDASDEIRPRYLTEHLRKVWAAINYNWRIWGYFHWTLVDCFEWDGGWTRRFGLWSLDPQSQVRIKRRSADFYADICRTNGLSAESISTYAPGVLEKIFPSDHQREFVNTNRQ